MIKSIHQQTSKHEKGTTISKRRKYICIVIWIQVNYKNIWAKLKKPRSSTLGTNERVVHSVCYSTLSKFTICCQLRSC